MHGFACVFNPSKLSPAPALLRPELANAPALKATHQAGRRGGESIARQSENYKSNSLALKADAP
ncbi:hypothetical protein PSJ58_21665 [Escherichia coli]|nr:hypothetical protein [Escherichia coli]